MKQVSQFNRVLLKVFYLQFIPTCWENKTPVATTDIETNAEYGIKVVMVDSKIAPNAAQHLLQMLREV